MLRCMFDVYLVLVSSGTQVQQQIILNPDYLPDYRSVPYDYNAKMPMLRFPNSQKKLLTKFVDAMSFILKENKKLMHS